MTDVIEKIKSEMQDVLENNILRFWLDKMVDHENGGFYGRMDGRGQLYPDAEKGAILNARILWSFSAAYRILGNLEYLGISRKAYDYFIDHFIDHEQGGVYWSVDYKGEPLDTKKQFYAIAFAIYGLAEYARATGNREALDYALQLFDCIEEHARDHENNGYIEALTRDWQPIADMRLSEVDANYPKSQNTHLHILEAYTNLYRVLKAQYPDNAETLGASNFTPAYGPMVSREDFIRVGRALRNIIQVFINHIINPETYHLDLFFENDWKRGAGRLESYGHDIECSWLIHEAALLLDDHDLLKQVEPIVQKVARAAEKGLKADGSMIHEVDLDTGRVDGDLHWWVQAEAVVGYMNIYEYFNDESALEKAVHCWEYIKSNLIDWERGEWWWSRHSDGTLNLEDDKAGFWKCPYHNSRMCLEIMERDF
ncbi:MAG: AGE family epimerase/isomerase [Prevotella sp.]|nr:AGE family epimerase/isomerase [Prevotella sp.]